MKEKKNIDRLYQENLKNLEVFPPSKSWNIIEKAMVTSTTKEKRSKTSLWVRVSSIAATFLMFLSVSAIYIAPNSNFSKRIINTFTNKKAPETTSKIEKKQEKNTVNKIGETKELEEVKPLQVVKTEKIKTSATKKQELETQLLKTEKEIEKKLLAKEFFQKRESKKQLSKPVSIKDTESKFTVATVFAPVYFNTFNQGSNLGNQFKNSTTTGGTSYSYGIKFAYKLNNKFTLQSGVNLINLESNTSNVYITPGVAVLDLSAINTESSSINRGVASRAVAKESSTTINQQFGYVEIPVEVKYNLINGKVGVNLIGGFSTMLLNKDEIYLRGSDIYQNIGNSNNLRLINFSGNLGVDIDYSIRKNLYLNVSPMFKVQTNTLSKNSEGLLPYYIGVYTGLNYKF